MRYKTSVDTPSRARCTLDRARRFLDLAERADPNTERRELEDFLAAAIIFGRSVTFHLQKEYADHKGFKKWYAERQEEMRADPLMRSLLDMRNDELHVRPARPRRQVQMELTATVRVTASVAVQRGSPWYRRSPRILWADTHRRLHALIDKVRRQRTASEAASATGSARISADELFLERDDPSLAQPAFELVHEYLGKLEPIVAAAEARFAGTAATASDRACYLRAQPTAQRTRPDEMGPQSAGRGKQ